MVADSLLKQEVQELTRDLWHDRLMKRVRDAATRKGIREGEALLVGFIGSEGEEAYGMFVLMSGEMFEFELTDRGFRRWVPVHDAASILDKFPAAVIGQRMAKKLWPLRMALRRQSGPLALSRT